MPSPWREPWCEKGRKEGKNSWIFNFVYTGFGGHIGPSQKHRTKRNHTVGKKWGHTLKRHHQYSVKEHSKDHCNSHIAPYCSQQGLSRYIPDTVQDTEDKQVICSQGLHLCC